MKRFLKIMVALVLLVLGYLLYANSGRGFEQPQSLQIDVLQSVGDSTLQRGNVVGLQTFMEAGDYASEQRFYQKIAAYFQAAQQRHWLQPNKTVVVLPEYVGTWLVVANEKSGVYTAASLNSALTTLVTSNLGSFAQSYWHAPEATKATLNHAVFAMKAAEMAAMYQRVFSRLAKQYQVWVVAGSILLPQPTVKNGLLAVNPSGQLRNISAVFAPSGILQEPLVEKAYPTADETSFVCAGSSDSVSTIRTSVGEMGVLICADAWYASSYRQLLKNHASFVVVPSYSAGHGLWQQPWHGYSANPTPKEATADVGKITLGQAWERHAMALRAYKEANIQKGMNVFLQGNLWDLGADGSTIALSDSTVYATPFIGKSAIINLWL